MTTQFFVFIPKFLNVYGPFLSSKKADDLIKILRSEHCSRPWDVEPFSAFLFSFPKGGSLRFEPTTEKLVASDSCIVTVFD